MKQRCRTCGLTHIFGIEGLACDEVNTPHAPFSAPYREWEAANEPDAWTLALTRQRREQRRNDVRTTGEKEET